MTNMSKAYRTAFAGRRGFTLIELIIVLVVIGLIIMLGVPLVGQLVKQNKLAEDRATVLEAKSTLIGYGQARAGYPSPDTGNLLPHATLTMRGADAEGNKLVYDVNDKLTVTATGGNLRTFCINVRLELALNNPPKIWNATDFSNPANSAPVAFVVFSRGPNFTADRQNTPVPGDRIYENPSTAFTDTYQDVVASYSLFDLQSWCNTNAGPGVRRHLPGGQRGADRASRKDTLDLHEQRRPGPRLQGGCGRTRWRPAAGGGLVLCDESRPDRDRGGMRERGAS